MDTVKISAEINSVDIPLFEALFKRVKAKSIKIEKRDPTKMSKEEFFAMIDKRRKSKSIKMSMEDMQDLLVIMQRKDEPKSPFSEALGRIKKYREKNLNTESR